MKTLESIPVRVTGPGSQLQESEAERLEFVALPKEMSSYRAPDLPDQQQVKPGHGFPS